MMEEILKKYPYEENCPFRLILDHFGNKWSMLIVITLTVNKKMRFNELNKKITGISQKMLASTLHLLERDGFITRTVYREIPPHVEYELTSLGHKLLPLIESVTEWVILYKEEIKEAQVKKLL